MQAGSSTVSGDAAKGATGAGSIGADSSTVSGVAEREVKGSGAVAAQSSIVEGTGIGKELPVPDRRKLFVEGDFSRTYDVGAEDRTFVVVAEDRTFRGV